MQLRHLRAAHRDGHRVVARVARVRLQRRKTVVLCLVVVIVVGYRCLMVLMGGWAVMVLGMIVPGVLVDVQRSAQGG
jgi:fatty acid desaturase